VPAEYYLKEENGDKSVGEAIVKIQKEKY